jgi:hypothetical protein
MSLVLALPPPVPGRPTTLLLLPWRQGSVLAVLTASDPEATLLGIGAGGWLMGVRYARADLPKRLTAAGVAFMFDGAGLGCR